MIYQPHQFRLRDLPAKLARDCGGLAAVEFAIIFPFMALLYLGSYEITQAVAAQRQVTLTASTVANVTTQYASISQTATVPDVLKAAVMVMTPYPASKAIVVVSVVTIDANKNATIAWSCAMSNGGNGLQQLEQQFEIAGLSRRAAGSSGDSQHRGRLGRNDIYLHAIGRFPSPRHDETCTLLSSCCHALPPGR